MALPILSILPFIKPVVEEIIDLIPNKEAREKARLEAELEMAKIDQQLLATLAELDKGQMAINQEEAKSSNLLVAGWRPFVGWTCASSFAWAFVIQPFVIFLFAAFGHPIPIESLPVMDIGTMSSVLLGLLGLGGLRTFEKYKGVAK